MPNGERGPEGRPQKTRVPSEEPGVGRDEFESLTGIPESDSPQVDLDNSPESEEQPDKEK